MSSPLDRIEAEVRGNSQAKSLNEWRVIVNRDDVLALVAVARAAREHAHEDPSYAWGEDAAGIHIYDPEDDPRGCPQCQALARLDAVGGAAGNEDA